MMTLLGAGSLTPGAGATALLDTFSGSLASHIPDLGPIPTIFSGASDVNNGVLSSTISGVRLFAAADAGESDRSIGVDMIIPAAPYTSHVCFRVSSDGNSSLRYICQHDGTTGYLALAEVGVM